jgi:tetratricopeptide (TPR) repeat protein
LIDAQALVLILSETANVGRKALDYQWQYPTPAPRKGRRAGCCTGKPVGGGRTGGIGSTPFFIRRCYMAAKFRAVREWLKAPMGCCVLLYIYSVMGASCYFSWQFAREHGFWSYISYGDFVSLGKGIVWPYFAFCSGESADECIDRGETAANKEDWDSAITEYTNAIRLDPKRADAWCGLGAAYGEKREWNKAIADLSEAIRLNPKSVSAHFQRGCAYLGRGCPSFAFDKSGTSVGRLVGAAAWGFLGLGNADFDSAIADFTEAIRLKPDCAEAYYCRGIAYKMMGEKYKAEADLTESKRLGYKPP